MLWHHLQRLLIGAWLLFIVAFGYAIRLTWIAPINTGECGTKEVVAWCGVVDPHPRHQAGKTLFRNNCASCHAGDMKSDLTGPALGGVRDRWAAHGGDSLLYAFIRNSQAIITTGKNGRANELWTDWRPTIMNSFEALTDEEIEALLAYIELDY